MTAAPQDPAMPAGMKGVADLRTTVHEVGDAARVALLTFAAELALETLPQSPEREEGYRALCLAARLAAGEMVDPVTIVDALSDEDEEGLLIYHQRAPKGPIRQAWGAVASVLGYAACQGSRWLGESPYPLVENYDVKEGLDWAVDPFVGVTDLDWTALARATAYVREHASKAGEGWGQPLRVDDLRRAAGR